MKHMEAERRAAQELEIEREVQAQCSRKRCHRCGARADHLTLFIDRAN